MRSTSFVSSALANALGTVVASGVLAVAGLASDSTTVINNYHQTNITISGQCAAVQQQIEIVLPPTQ